MIRTSFPYGNLVMSRVFAYCRVSTLEQNTENQRREIEAAGFAVKSQRLIEEHISGSVAASERPGFTRLLDRMENGDVLIVTKLDRLGRNAMDVRKTVEQLATSDIRVHCLALGGVDLTSPAGKMTMQVISAVAEFEKDLLIERTHSGIARARASGKRFGRPSSLNGEQQQVVLERLNAGTSISAIAREFGTSRQTVIRLRDKVGS
jgi:putative DNA-invertase from lambdoid prophage Rac